MKKILFLAVCCFVLFTTQAQTTSLVINNQTNHTIYFELYGNSAGTCSAANASGVLDVPAYSSRTFSSVVGWIPGLSLGDLFTMVGIYSGNPNPPSGSPCSAGSIGGGYVSECYALGYGPGPTITGTTYPSPPLCVTGSVTIQWYSNVPSTGTSTVVIN